MDRPALVRLSIFLSTVVATWAVLSLGGPEESLGLVEGSPAPATFKAELPAEVVDENETAAKRFAAREAVEPDEARQTQPDVESSVTDSVNAVFDDLESVAVGDVPSTPPTTLPELPPSTSSTTVPAGDSTTTTLPPAPLLVTGVVFLDVDGDGVYRPEAQGERIDQGLERVDVQIRIEGEPVRIVQTGPGGVWSYETSTGSLVVSVIDSDIHIPEGWVVGTDNLNQLVTCVIDQPCQAANVGFSVNTRPLADIEAAIAAKHPIPGETISYLAALASDDVLRAALGEPLHLITVRQAALQRVLEEFGRRVTPDDLQEAKARQRTRPPLVFHEDTGQDATGGEAAGEIVATFLQANYVVNAELLAELQDEAASSVPAVTVRYVVGQTIVEEGDPMSRLHIDAITQTSTQRVEQASVGMLAVVTVLVALIGLYLARFRPEFWARPRMVALLGILILIAAASVRGATVMHEASSWYVFPAVAFGFIAAILFDQRIAILLALAVGVLTAVGTLNTGISVYAVLGGLAPVPFVSSVSTRGAFRNAVIYSSLAAAMIAASTSWFFYTGTSDAVAEFVAASVIWAFGVSAAASLVALAALQFFESAFDITTTLSLLDLTDRNHAALQLLQEEAFGTFNHSLMVGTLADAAARSIGANPLLARAMAYYHDLGKTQNPLYFIENQFGISNPHNTLDPKESAEIIRSHVTAGVALARQFKIPSDIASGIVSHHGDGIMRYFYEKGREVYGDDVNVDDYRHAGHKPRTQETAILMLADSLEAACRAVFQTEEPTGDAIEKVVDRVVNEKMEDGQLSESPLTLGEITQIRRAFIDSLGGHYHQRIAYPNFPGS